MEAQETGSICILKSVSSMCKKLKKTDGFLSLLLLQREVCCLSNVAAALMMHCLESGI